MRMIRRTRPSQVGCGASVARRRLQHSSSSPATPAADEAAVSPLARLVPIDARDLAGIGDRWADLSDTEPARFQVGHLASVRGR